MSRREVWSIFSRHNFFFVPLSLLVCSQLRPSSFLTSHPLFLLQAYSYTWKWRQHVPSKRRLHVLWTTERTTPPSSDLPSHLFVNPLESGYIILVTHCMYTKKESITIDSVEFCMWSGWRGRERGGENQGTTMSKWEACQYRFCHVFCRHNVVACQGNYLTSRHFFLLKLTQKETESFMNPITPSCISTQDTLLDLSLCFSKKSLTRNMARKISTLRCTRVCDISSLH